MGPARPWRTRNHHDLPHVLNKGGGEVISCPERVRDPSALRAMIARIRSAQNPFAVMARAMSYGVDFRLAHESVLSLRSRLSPAVSGISAKRDLAAEDELRFHFEYQARYTKELRAVRALAPDQYHEFRKCYEPDPKRRGLGYVMYVIQDYIKGIAVNSILYPGLDSRKRTVQCLANQVVILGSLDSPIDSVLSNTKASLQADLQDVELETAKSLIKASPRAAGALAGAILESYLQEVAAIQQVKATKKNPTVSDFNDFLKQAGACDAATWRKISLADIPNMCTHRRSTDPTPEQAIELIEGADCVAEKVI